MSAVDAYLSGDLLMQATATRGSKTVDTLPSLDELLPSLERMGLIDRLTGVLRFARTNLEHLDRHAQFWPEEKSAIVSQADKVIVETALLALLASRVNSPGSLLGDELRALVSQIAPLARSESNQVRLLRFPQTAASLGIAHISLSGLGHRDEAFDALIRSAFSSGHVGAMERLPYRMMDLTWLLAIHDPDTEPNFEELIPHSILTSCAHPVYMAEIDAYAVTHALMYLTDFGARSLPRSISRVYVSEMIDACLAWHLLSGNMDLMGELLMSAALIGGPWSPYARIAIRMLIAIWDEFGFLPSATFDVADYRNLSGDEESAYAFHHVYHTTYVAGILCQVLLRCPEIGASTRLWTNSARVATSLLSQCEKALCAAHEFCAWHGAETSTAASSPEIRPNSLQAASGAAFRPPDHVDLTLRRTIALIGKVPCPCSRPGAPWMAAVADASELGTDELALVLSDALLIQAAREYNLPLLAEALIERAASSLPLSSTLLESTSFLLRQQLPSGAIGAHFVIPENCSSPQAVNVTATLADCIARVMIYIRANTSAGFSPTDHGALA